MEINQNILINIFGLQEKVIQRYIEEYKDRFSLISECFFALSTIEFPKNIKSMDEHAKRVVFNYFSADALSTLTNAIRLSLHGCESDSYALMRVVMENLTILQYIMKFNLYQEALGEIILRADKGKNFSEKFSYQKAVNELEISDRREKLRGQMSNIGSHISPHRLMTNMFILGDQQHVRIGMALNNPRIKIALGELAAISLFTVILTDDFIRSTYESEAIDFHELRIDLEQKYKENKD